jgi:hypothetical protein
VRGSSPGGHSGQWEVDARRPTVNRESPEWSKGAAVVLRAPGARGKEKRAKWIECGLLVLLGSRGKEEEQGHGGNEVAGWRSGWRGARGKGQRGREAGPGKGRALCGGEGSRRWRRGGTGAAVSGVDDRRQRSQRSRAECQRKKKREGGPKDFLGICKNLRDLTVN